VHNFRRHIGLVGKGGCGRGYFREIGGTARAGVRRAHSSSVDSLDGRSSDGVNVVTHLILHSFFALADLIGPDGASILEMNDVARGRQRRQKH